MLYTFFSLHTTKNPGRAVGIFNICYIGQLSESSQAGRYFLHPWQTGVEKHSVGLAEIIFPRFFSRLLPVPAASSAAYREIQAGSAFLRVVHRAFHKPFFLSFPFNFSKAIFPQIAKAITVQHIKIAGVHAAVCFHNILKAADSPLLAGFREMPQKNPDIIFKLADIRLLSLPQI